MVDRISKEHRSWNMSKIRSKDTGPEKVVRTLLHKMGFRFRLHVKHLPGSPDIVLPKHHAVIFVHGCYWHRHEGCKLAYKPKSRTEFWEKKFKENVERDKRKLGALKDSNWKILVVWECEVKNRTLLMENLSNFLRQIP